MPRSATAPNAEFWRDHLVRDVLPFFLRHALDREYGGYRTCLANDGTLEADDKYLWSQGRGVWTFSAAYNRVARDPDYLEAARLGVRFLLAHGRDADGRWVFHTDRRGRPVEGATSIFSDLFAVYGLTEYYRATGDRAALEVARATMDSSVRRIAEPGFSAIAPARYPVGGRPHSIPMILIEVAGELERSVADPALSRIADDAAEAILRRHYRPKLGVMLENVTPEGGDLAPPEGTLVNPGHSIESAWFLIHWARRRNRPDVEATATNIIRRALEVGWDRDYGGIFTGIDASGGPTTALPYADRKTWWPHTEALYALKLVEEGSGESWATEWFDKVFEWVRTHHFSPWGDWYQRLDRQGRPTTWVTALPVKDPYHLPRALILLWQLERRRAGQPGEHDPFSAIPPARDTG